MAAPAFQTRPRPGELVGRMRGIAEAARKRQMTISHLLEEEDPTNDYDAAERASGLDAFGRILRLTNIRTSTVLAAGIVADEVSAFGKDENTAIIFAEWVERRKREVTLPQTRAQYTSADQPPGTALNQIAFDLQPYYKQIAPAVPIAEVVAKTTPIVGGTYQAYFLADVTAQERYTRIPEGVEVPAVKLTGSNHTIKVRKFGRRLDATYEQLRRMRIDLLALHIQRMMVQAEVDKLAAIIDVMVNGDASGGNGATSYTLSSLDSSVVSPTGAASLTLRGYLRFKAKFRNPYRVTTMLAQEDMVVGTQLLNTGTANIPLMFLQAQRQNGPLGDLVPINNELGDSVRMGLSDDAISGKIIGLDARFAIERIVEIGSDITESTRWVEKQTQSLVMTFDEGYAVIDANALKVLDCTS